jgi:type I restriction enzyme, S subunit
VTLPSVELGTVASIERKSVKPDEIRSHLSYVGLENITADGTFVEVAPAGEADIKSNKFAFSSDHILYGKLRPYLSKIAAPQFGGVCSTDIVPIRPGPDLDRRFLLHVLRTPAMVGHATRLAVGANLPRLSPKSLETFPIPLPPIEEQGRIAAVLDVVGELRAKRREALAKLDTLTQAIFIDMFGDPIANPRGLPRGRLGDVAVQVTDGEHATPPRTSDGVKLLSARNVQDGYLDFANVDYVSDETYEALRRRLEPSMGDILISCSGTIGRVARIQEHVRIALVRSVAFVRPDRAKVRPEFLEAYLRTETMRRTMEHRANASSQKNLFQGQVRELPLLVPSLDDQDKLAGRLQAVADQRALLLSASRQLGALFSSLQQRAFRGEL